MSHDDESGPFLVEGSLRVVVLMLEGFIPKMAAISPRSISAGGAENEDVVQISALWAFFPAAVLLEISSNSRSAHL